MASPDAGWLIRYADEEMGTAVAIWFARAVAILSAAPGRASEHGEHR